MSDAATLSALLRGERERAGLTLDAAATALGSPPVTLRSWEAEPDKMHYRRVSRENLVRVLDLYGTEGMARAMILDAFFAAAPSKAKAKAEPAAESA
jgi:predicted ATPase